MPPNGCMWPPKQVLCSPKRSLCPEQINRLGAIGIQFEANIVVITLEFVGKNCFFVDFAINTNCLCGLTSGFMKILRKFWEEDLFYGLYLRICGNLHNFWDEDQNLWIYAYSLGHRPFIFGSDYFTENFQVKENKTKMRNIYPRFFHLLF